MPSESVENYIKAIFKLSERNPENVSTSAIAGEMHTAAASVSDMLRKLADQDLVVYEKYRGAQLTEAGERLAKRLVRKHRLWEVFLTRKLGFSWDAVHDMAEELEHVDHPELIDRLDEFLGRPPYDPHGDPIPDREGRIAYHPELHLHELGKGERGVIVAVTDHTPEFLRYLDKVKLVLYAEVEVLDTEEYDASRSIRITGGETLTISDKVSRNLLVRKLS